MTIFTAASCPGRARGPSCDEPPTKLKVRVAGAASRGRRVGEPGDPCTGGRRAQHPAGAVGGCVEQCVRRAAKRRRLPCVRHHVLGHAARAEAGDDAALPSVLGPPVEDRAPHERRSKVTRRRQVHCETCRRNRRLRGGGGGRRRRAAGQRATGGPLEGCDGLLAVRQVVERLPRVAGRVVPRQQTST